jgi:hypothetical protein
MLEANVKKRVEAIAAARKAQEDAATEVEQQAKKVFTDANKKLSEFAKSLGVKGEITTAAYGESRVPFAKFAVMEVSVALEDRGSELLLLVDGDPLPVKFPFHPDGKKESLKEAVEEALTEKIASIVDQRTQTEPKPPTKAE